MKTSPLKAAEPHVADPRYPVYPGSTRVFTTNGKPRSSSVKTTAGTVK